MKTKRKPRLAGRISASFILLITIAFSLVLVITSLRMLRILSSEYTLYLTEQLGNIGDSLDQTINDIFKINESIQNDGRLKNAIQTWYVDTAAPALPVSTEIPASTAGGPEAENENAAAHAAESKEPAEEVLFETENLVRIRSLSTLISCVYLYDRDGSMIASYDNNRRPDSFRQELSGAVSVFRSQKAYRSFVPLGNTIFYLCSLYQSDYRYNAYLALEVNRNRLFFRCFQNAYGLFPVLCITDGTHWIASLDGSFPGAPETLLSGGETSYDGSSYLVINSHSRSYADWKLVGLYDRSSLSREMFRQIYPLLIVFLITIPAVILISLLISRHVTRPVSDLSASMQLVEQGLYPPPLSVERSDEVGTLVEGFNHMVASLSDLHRNLLEEQTEKQKIELASLNTRLQLLQSQINPHFIYNTLNTMNYMASEAGNEELSELIYSFSSLLRSSISTDSDFVPVHTEIDSVKYYLKIQARRYADIRLHFFCDIDPEAENLLLPRMILQPLVENSLIHGILPNGKDEGTITIRCSREDGYLHVLVKDDGAGISEEKLALLSSGALKVSNGYNHIGLNNVRERIEILYQQDCDFRMESREGSGTSIMFRVPVNLQT